jgi:hypothetical protein
MAAGRYSVLTRVMSEVEQRVLAARIHEYEIPFRPRFPNHASA